MRTSRTGSDSAEYSPAPSENRPPIGLLHAGYAARTIQQRLRLRVEPPGDPGLVSLGRYFSPQAALGFFPRYELDFADIDLSKATGNFLLPCLGHIVRRDQTTIFVFPKHGLFYLGCGTIRAIRYLSFSTMK